MESALSGGLRLKDFVLKGENNEYSAGPVNGVIPSCLRQVC